MIIDYNQHKNGIDISYVNEENKISMITAPLTYGYYKYVAAEPYDSGIIPNLKSFKNNSLIKREPAKYFNNHNVNEFFNFELKENCPDINEKVSQLRIPSPFSVDIETEITDEFGYSKPEKAENKILSISITDENLNTIVFSLKHKDNPKFELSEEDNESIRNMVHNALGEHANRFEYNFQTRFFDKEVDMLNTFLECINKYFHSIIGWNFSLFDWVYIFNRCKRLGIDIKKGSPISKITKKTYTMRDDSTITVELPSHRVISDYMLFFQESLIYNSLDSYSLPNIANLILKLDKIMYEGNLRTLYNSNFNKFLAYAIIDTILVMLIHKATNLYNVNFFESYFNKIPYLKISQNSISEALVYNELRQNNQFLLESEFNNIIKRKYRGGYVKTPTKKIIECGLGVDFSGLYPNSIITNGISPEKKVDVLEMNEELCEPTNDVDKRKWAEYKKMGFTLTPRGTVYDSREDGLFVTIEKKLIAKRKVFKGYAEDIYLDILPSLENRLKELQSK